MSVDTGKVARGAYGWAGPGAICAKPDDQGCCGLHAYGRAKLVNLAYTLDLAQRLKGDGISVFAADPGGAVTTMTSGTMSSSRVVAPWLRPKGPWSLTFGPTLTVFALRPDRP
ncbi:hypothetical protein [Streptomyces malaysiensis]|uniref:hypothetical protein n=1 Tax=Streptomyces malaysiensis TaxID=92644 RepID=UPI003D2F86E3